MTKGDKIIDLRDGWEGIYIRLEDETILRDLLAAVVWTKICDRDFFVSGRPGSGTEQPVLRKYICTSPFGHIGNPCIFCEYKYENTKAANNDVDADLANL